MQFDVIDLKDVDWDKMNKITPYSIFSQTNTLKIALKVFEKQYLFGVLSDTDTIKAVMPFFVEDNIITPVGYYGDNDMFDFAPISYETPENFVELVKKINEWSKQQGYGLDLRELPSIFNPYLVSLDLQVQRDAIIPIVNIDKNSQVKEGKTIFKKKHRKEMRRKLNRLKNENMEYNVILDAPKTDELMDKFAEFFEKSANDEKQKFIQSKAVEYFREFLKFEEIKFSTMHFNGKLVSILVYFNNSSKWAIDTDNRKKLYLYNMASDTEFYDYSPGLIHINSIIMEVIENGYDEFNFLRGAERYKFEIGANACNWNIKVEASDEVARS